MRTRLLLITGLVSLVMLHACKKDDEATPPVITLPEYNPTPYNINYPAWVSLYAGAMLSSPDNPTTVEGVALGRKLFYDKRLSDNQTMSCATCHRQENAFTDPRRFSEGTNGALGDRNGMAIINLGWDKGFFWDGRRTTLEEQAHDPVTNPIEMRNTWPVVVERLKQDPNYPIMFYKAFGATRIDSNLVVKAIAQFERTLVSFNSRFDKYYFDGDTNALNAQEKRGMALYFGRGSCDHCHSGPLLAENAFRNNGLDEFFLDIGYGKVTGRHADDGKFKVTTLRNIAHTGPYMHDGRFATLEEVVDHYDHGVKKGSPNLDTNMDPLKNGIFLTAQQKADLVAFLHTFTDTVFLTNPSFKEPQ